MIIGPRDGRIDDGGEINSAGADAIVVGVDCDIAAAAGGNNDDDDDVDAFDLRYSVTNAVANAVDAASTVDVIIVTVVGLDVDVDISGIRNAAPSDSCCIRDGCIVGRRDVDTTIDAAVAVTAATEGADERTSREIEFICD